MAFLDFLPTIGGAISTLWNSTVGQSQSKSLMRYQQRLQQESIDNMNRYNSPVAQMERLRAAGLNPNLVYGSGVDGNQGSAASVGLSNRNPQSDFGFAESVNNVFRRRQLENENRLTDANESKIMADSMLSKARYLDVMQDVARKDATFNTFVEKAAADLEHTRQSIEESKARTSKVTEEWNNLLLQRDKVLEEVRYWKAHATNEELQPDVIRAKIANLASSTELNRAQKDVAHSIARLNDKRIDELVARIRNINSDSDLKELSYRLQKSMADFGAGNISMKDILGLIKSVLITAFK